MRWCDWRASIVTNNPTKLQPLPNDSGFFRTFAAKLQTMTIEEALKDLTSKPEWYRPIGITPQAAWNVKDRLAKGKLSHDSMASILQQFGYTCEEVWHKPTTNEDSDSRE